MTGMGVTTSRVHVEAAYYLALNSVVPTPYIHVNACKQNVVKNKSCILM